jgi:F0F1-type ATP synthase membrane subunit c/vacuolar-type H+-ATPase subunit K
MVDPVLLLMVSMELVVVLVVVVVRLLPEEAVRQALVLLAVMAAMEVGAEYNLAVMVAGEMFLVVGEEPEEEHKIFTTSLVVMVLPEVLVK